MLHKDKRQHPAGTNLRGELLQEGRAYVARTASKRTLLLSGSWHSE